MPPRPTAAAEPGTTLVTGTTQELALGTGIEFVDRGRFAFKGISGERQVFEATPPSAPSGS